MCLGKPFQPERKLACDIQNKAKAPAMISKLDRWCNWDNKNRPAIATRINSLSSLLLEDIGSPTKQWFADNLRHLPLPPVTPNAKVESSAYPGHFLNFAPGFSACQFYILSLFERTLHRDFYESVHISAGILRNQ